MVNALIGHIFFPTINPVHPPLVILAWTKKDAFTAKEYKTKSLNYGTERIKITELDIELEIKAIRALLDQEFKYSLYERTIDKWKKHLENEIMKAQRRLREFDVLTTRLKELENKRSRGK